MSENYQRIEFAEMFKRRTKKFVVDNILFFRTLPKTEEAKIIGRQLLRSSSSVGANYRAACRARSQAEFQFKAINCSGGSRRICFLDGNIG